MYDIRACVNFFLIFVENYCCCMLLMWHSVVEITMVEPVWRVAFTPWHQTWHRAYPKLFSCPTRLSNKPSLPRLLCFPHSSFSFSSFSPLHHSYFLPLDMPPVYFSPSLSSQFHPFFCPTKTAIQPWHFKANKTSSENAKPAQKCHLRRDFFLNIRSRSLRQLLCFSVTEGVTVFHRPCVGEG